MSEKLIIKKDPKVAVFYRLATPAAVTLAKALTKWLNGKKIKVYTAPQQKIIAGTTLLRKSDFDKISLIVVLGGDGTYLRAVRMLEGLPIPILGVNLGSLGFLTTTRSDEAFSVVEHTLQNKMELTPRSMLQVQVKRKGKIFIDTMALNDAVIERGSLSQLINVAIKSEKQLISEVKSDGIIISSPTGSTAYNLAAGGPILHPSAKAIVITPIAPHSLTSRPLIMPDACMMSFKLVGKLQRAHFVVDGQKLADLSADDEVIIKKSKMDHWMVKDPAHNYFRLLREKLKFGDRA
jgi:NAD+ kinase